MSRFNNFFNLIVVRMKSMKNLMMMMVFVLFAVTAFGQSVRKMIQWELNPILNTVKVTEAEKKELIVPIERFVTKRKQIRKADSENKQAESAENARQYLNDMKAILGNERFNKWRKYIREKRAKNNSSNR